MTLPSLVAFSGFTESGKDVAADIMVQRARFVKTWTTKPLEEALVKLNPWVEDGKEGTIERFEELYTNLGDRAIKDFPESRRLLLTLEREVGRKNGANLWFDELFDEVGALLGDDKKVVISGVQHLNEQAMVRDFGGVCVWIDRPVKYRGGTFVNQNDCDLVVKNDGSPKDLYVKLVVALEEYNSHKSKDE